MTAQHGATLQAGEAKLPALEKAQLVFQSIMEGDQINFAKDLKDIQAGFDGGLLLFPLPRSCLYGEYLCKTNGGDE